MRTATAAAATIIAAMGTIGCFPMGPAGPVVHEHHDVERGAATQARVEIEMTAGDLEPSCSKATSISTCPC